MALRCFARSKGCVPFQLRRISVGPENGQYRSYATVDIDDHEKSSVLEGEEYYKYFLTVAKVRPSRFAPMARLFRRHSVEHKTTLLEPITEDPLKMLDADSASFATVTNCPEAYIFQMRDESKWTQRRRHIQDEPGTRALNWLFRAKALKSVELARHDQLAEAIGFCLAGQERTGETQLWDLLKSDHRPLNEGIYTQHTANAFPSSILRNFIGFACRTMLFIHYCRGY
jgi:hypothetical protein